MATHLVQIVNKPHQIIVSEVRDTFLILLFTKYVVNPSVKFG